MNQVKLNIRAKPAGFLAARSLGSLENRMTARWVLGVQDPGFPAEEEEKEEIKNLSRGEGGDQEGIKRGRRSRFCEGSLSQSG